MVLISRACVSLLWRPLTHFLDVLWVALWSQEREAEGLRQRIRQLDQEKLAWTAASVQAAQSTRESNKKELEFIQATHTRYR